MEKRYCSQCLALHKHEDGEPIDCHGGWKQPTIPPEDDNQQQTTANLVMLVKVLARKVIRANPADEQAKAALAYLADQELITTADILR